MKIIKAINYVKSAIKDPERELSERVFIIFTIISELAAIFALIGDILIKENIGEIITLIIVITSVPIITFGGLYLEKINLAIRLIVICIVLFILPSLFFFGGGIHGGGIIWVMFGFIYIGLVISGKWRKVLLTFMVLETIGFYLIDYYYPELIIDHSTNLDNVDTAISLLLVGIVCFGMTWFQTFLFREENERAKKETERAEELSRQQNRFFSSMSHEIRTPINSILGLNELILREKDASDEIVKDATGIQGAGKLLLSLINDILDFSKMEAESMDIVPVDYRIGDMLSEIVNMIWLKAHDKGLQFNVSVDPQVPTVLYGDEVRIKQIIINLLNNAVKYTAEGSIELRVESENIDDKFTNITISVSDTGMGIKKEALPNLFDAFKRVDEEKNRYIEGTGLGLSIVKQLVELMDGTISVNSVYGDGSTFSVTLKQGISDISEIGDLNIHNQALAKRSQYESNFKAPEAKILIIDDNEMNLEVEKKLLISTQMNIDTVLSGKDALEKTLEKKYDVILMDHLMPVMSGIECLEYIRSQSGGLNRTTPVIVLTANAGSDNRDLYNRAGFDGYLVKPVSGASLEDMLMKYISKDKLIISDKMMRMREDISTTAGYARKLPVIITTTSMSDIPDAVIKKYGIPIIPSIIHTEEGVFKDGVQMDANELIRYINTGKDAYSSPPDVKTYTEFFAGALKRAHHLIHISLTTSMSEDYYTATEAAKAFDNVTVICSECLSSATGILALIGYKLAQQNIPVNEIVEELENVKHRLRCSFIIDNTDFMARRGFISKNVGKIAKALNLHPYLKFKDDKSSVGGIWFGNTKRVYKNYIRRSFPVDIIPDSDVVFITYVDIPSDTLMWIKEEISKLAYFEKVVFKQASAAISSNCGPGTFGILYFVKSNKSYNIGSLITSEEVYDDAAEEPYEAIEALTINDNYGIKQEDIIVSNNDESVLLDEEGDKPWYKKISAIDLSKAIENSGSVDAFLTVAKIYYDSIKSKSDELESFFNDKDWENYTIKIHALKSSSKLIGAMELADKAQLLEDAGKAKDVEFITKNHSIFMDEYKAIGQEFKEALSDNEEANDDMPLADDFLMESVYEGLKESAENMDCDSISEIFKEVEGYKIPDKEKTKFDELVAKAGQFDYEGMLNILNED